MKMNANTDFLYRALIYVALHPERWVTAREVTEAYKLSHNHISKVCQELIRCGFLNAQRGRGGGVQLARKPEDIHLGELLFLDDDKPKIIDCETGIGGSCCIAPACRLKEIFAQTKRAFLDAMNSPALDEVISQPKLVSLFDPQAPK